jgi:hypothetical protein
VDTPDGSGVLEKIYLTELGLVMGKVFFPRRNVWINYTLSSIDNLFEIKSSIKKSIGNVKINRRRKIKNVLVK